MPDLDNLNAAVRTEYLRELTAGSRLSSDFIITASPIGPTAPWI